MNTTTTSAAASVLTAATKASNFAAQTVETARTEILKEPLGFIKIIQLLIAIITFGVAVNGGDTVSFQVTCDGGIRTIAKASYQYPYSLASSTWSPSQFCAGYVETQKTISDSSSTIVASAGFFVFTGVISFLYCITFIVIYVFFRHKYDNVTFVPLADFAFTVLITVFWFAGSIAWAKAVDDIKTATNSDNYLGQLYTCNQLSKKCAALPPYPTYASLIISCIFGFANLIIWGGNCWFVLKETTWYKSRQQAYAPNSDMRQSGSSNSNTSSNNNNNKI